MGSVQLRLKDILEHFHETYGCLCVAACAIFRDAQWVSALTVIRFSYKSPAASEQEIISLQESVGKIDSPAHKILYRIVPIEDASNFLEQTALTGELLIGDLKLASPSLKYLLERSAYISTQGGEVHGDAEQFPCFEFYVGERHQFLYDTGFRLTIQRLGFADVNLAVGSLLGINAIANRSYDLLVSAPIYARLEGLRWDPAGGMRCALIRHKHLAGVSVHAAVSAQDAYGQKRTLKKSSKATVLLEEGQSEDFLCEDCMAFLGDHSLVDWISISVVHDGIGEICSENDLLRKYLARQEKNPLIAITDLFCNRARFGSMLLQPQSEGDPATTFERAVSWLLSCLGFSVVWLGREHEKMYESGTRVELGSIDLIACHFVQGIVLLAGCTTSVPTSQDIDRLVELRIQITKRVGKIRRFEVLLAIFTSSTELTASRDLAQKAGVLIFSGTILSRLLRGVDLDAGERLVDILTRASDLEALE